MTLREANDDDKPAPARPGEGQLRAALSEEPQDLDGPLRNLVMALWDFDHGTVAAEEVCDRATDAAAALGLPYRF